MDYDENKIVEMAMKYLEGDILFVASKYHIPGYEYDDLCQELRMRLWNKIDKYDPRKSGIRAWANIVMRNHLKNLLRNSFRDRRKANNYCIYLINPPEF